MLPVSKDPLFCVAVWVWPAVLRQATRWPRVTLAGFGEKDMLPFSATMVMTTSAVPPVPPPPPPVGGGFVTPPPPRRPPGQRRARRARYGIQSFSSSWGDRAIHAAAVLSKCRAGRRAAVPNGLGAAGTRDVTELVRAYLSRNKHSRRQRVILSRGRAAGRAAGPWNRCS